MMINLFLLCFISFFTGTVTREKTIAEVLLPIFRTVGMDYSNRQGMINAMNATHFDHPYLVSFHNKSDGSHIGGGAIINPFWIISTADFTEWFSPQELFLKVGSRQEILFIEQYAVHPNYKTLGFESNLALYKVKNSIGLGKSVRSVPLLSERSIIKHSWAIVCGWSDSSLQIKYIKLKVYPRSFCVKQYGYKFTPKRVICANTYGSGPCYADFGDPLIYEGQLLGIFIGGYRCVNSNYPGMYTHIPHYYDWINSIAFDA